MKTSPIIGLLAAFLLPSPSLSLSLRTTGEITPQARDADIHAFERRFIDTISYQHPNHTVKLVGFKKIIMTPGQVLQLETNIQQNPSDWDQLDMAYYDPLEKVMRVYFPVENALVYHGNELLEANHLGEYEHAAIHGNCTVVGRYKTDKVTGVPGNIISEEDGIIYLAEPAPVIRTHDNIHVYDFGWRHGSHDHSHDHGHDGNRKRAEGSGGTCFQNHGGKVCSIAYNINQGRCTRPKGTIKECIDYNGWPIKNCNNHSDKWAFPGSDCFVAVARGHCWNEVEGALRGD